MKNIKTSLNFCENNVNVRNLREARCELLHASLAKSTWSKYESAFKLFYTYETFIGKSCQWPLDPEHAKDFATFCLSKRRLAPGTVRVYISALTYRNVLSGGHEKALYTKELHAILKGAENLRKIDECKVSKGGETRLVMTLPLLRLLGNKIAGITWSDLSKQVIWTVCVIAFFTSARMGELLSERKYSFDPTTTLTWRDVRYRSETDSYLIRIKSSKNSETEFLDMFCFKKFGCCPVNALKRLFELASKKTNFALENPVFSFENDRLLTKESLNSLLKVLLRDYLKEGEVISSHSFRAAVPSAIAKSKGFLSSEDVKHWGRWSGESYLRYTRLKLEQKQNIFERIVQIMQK